MKWERIMPWIEAHSFEIFFVSFFLIVISTINGL